MPLFNDIIDIPIYRCDEATFQKEYSKKFDQYLQKLGYQRPYHVTSESPRSLQLAIAYFEEENFYPWKFNEIVGFIRIYAHGYRIKGDLYYVKRERVTRNTKSKIYRDGSRMIERDFVPEDSSSKIYETLLNDLETLKVPPLNRRYLDLEDFRRCGMYIDWHNYFE